jgi:hypothetical protein
LDTTTPGSAAHTAVVHDGIAEVVQRRENTLATALAGLAHRSSSPFDPKILDLRNAAWINAPVTQT